MRRVAVIILSLVTLLILFFVMATYRVRPYEAVILDRFGTQIPSEQQTRLAYGWYLCWPTDKVVRMDKRLHLYRSELKQISTGSTEPVSVQAFAAWRINDPLLFYRRFAGSDENANSQLDSTVISKVSAILGSKSLDMLFGSFDDPTHGAEGKSGAATRSDELSPTGKIEDEVARAVNEDMKKVGVEVEQVGFARLAFPPYVANTIYERMSEERKTQAKRYTSEGMSKALEIRSEADRVAKQTMNTAQQ